MWEIICFSGDDPKKVRNIMNRNHYVLGCLDIVLLVSWHDKIGLDKIKKSENRQYCAFDNVVVIVIVLSLLLLLLLFLWLLSL